MLNMKSFALFIFFAITAVCFAQPKETAIGRYAENGNLISITNLSGLSECTAASVMGKIGKVKVEDSLSRTSVKADDAEIEVAVPLERLKPEDRNAIFKQLVRKKANVRIAGYKCNEGDPITAFSIDRIY
jgi:hypothetical protein